MMNEKRKVMTTREAAKFLGYSRASHVASLIRTGQLKARKIKTVPGDFGYNACGYRYEISQAVVQKFQLDRGLSNRGRPRKAAKTL